MAKPIRVLVVDDSAFMRTSLSRRIEQDCRFEVIGTAGDGQEAVAKALRLRPDVVTMDVEMPVMNGIEALRRIVAKSSIPVVMVSAQTQEGAKVTLEALEIGAIDVIPKAHGAELIHEKLFAAANANLISKLDPAKPAVPQPRSFPTLRPDIKIVIIGSSTGGPQALNRVISQLPPNLSVPIVVAQHMPAYFTLALAKRLDESCPPRVVEASDGAPLVKGTVYIAPGGLHLRVTLDRLKVTADNGESLYKPSVDVLAESAFAAFGKHVLGVMLTGMGNDGAREFTRLRRAGAYIIAQDQATSVVWGMPRAVLEAGAADEVLALEHIGGRIAEILGVSPRAYELAPSED